MKIFIFKAWCVACAIFCILSLQTLVEDRYEVAILARNESEMDPTISLICKELNSFQLDKTEMRLEILRDKLVNYFNRLEYTPVWGVDLDSTKHLIVNRVKTGQYLIFNGLFCILLKRKSEGSDMSLILSYPVFFAFKNSTLDFSQMASLSKSFDQVIVEKRGPPYSNCSKTNERFKCLNECFKDHFRLSRYFYGGNETGLIHLKSETNQSVEESEKSCFEKCQRENCKIVLFFPASENRKPETTFGTEPKLSEFFFWVQFIGLVCSFANISLNQFASLVIHFASSKVKRRKVRIALFCLKWTILFLSLILCGYLYTTMFLDYKADERSPPRKEITRNFIKQKTVRLAICMYVENYFTVGYLKKTMSEIEKATDSALNDYLKGIYMNYQERLFKVDYITEPKVLFKKFAGLRRCFSLLIFPDYHLMISNPKLTIKFKIFFPNLELFILTENEDLNQKTFKYSPKKAFMKTVLRRLKQTGRCVSYRESDTHCTGKMNCIENCINREAFEEFNKIVIDKAVIDKDQFNPEEWNTTYPMEVESYKPWLGRTDPNYPIYENISSWCFKKFQDDPCVEVEFNETRDIDSIDGESKEIDLFLDVELSIEELSLFNLLLNILNIQSIFFGMTVLKLLKMIYSFFKPKLWLKLRNQKVAQFLIYLLCSIGFIWHTYCIFDLSINGELIYNPNYEIVNRTQMPVMVFCLPVDEKLVDKNHRLTGNYLEHVTSDMTSKSLFESIAYLNELNEWIPFNLSLSKQFFFMHLKCYRITIYQEYDRRQFHFSTNSQVLKVLKVNFAKKFINRKTVYFMTETKETGFSNVENLVYDYQRKGETRYSAKQNKLTVKYEDRFSFMKKLLSTSYEDHFNDLDGQLSELKGSGLDFKTLKIPVKKRDFDCEILDDLYEQLFVQIKNKTTYNLLDSLDYQQTFSFNQLKKFVYSDSDFDYYDEGFDLFDPYDPYDSAFTFSLVLIKKTLSAKNEENFAKLVLNLLNVLFIWFDLGILDLHPIFMLTHDYLLVYLYLHWPRYLLEKFTQFLHFSYRWLKKFEQPLYGRIKPRKRNAPQSLQA